MKNNKGFTLVEILGVFVILALILGISIVSYRFIMDRVNKNYYETLEQELLLAGSDYFNNSRNEKPVSGYSMVLIDELVENKYIETLKDRSGNVCSPNNDSKVYVYKTDTGYDYEACLFCDALYPPSGNYCNGNIMGEIIISAKKENTNAEYNVLKTSYSNTSWSNENVVVTFKMNDKNVTKYIVVDVNDNSEKVCNANNNSCSMIFNSSGSYTVEAYDNETVVGSKRSFHIKIDKDKPVCEFISGPSVDLINKSIVSTYELECTDNNLDTGSITTNSFSQTSENVITIQNIGTNNITNGYKYIVTVVGNLDGETKLMLNENIVKDKAGNGNANTLSNKVNSDVTAPSISYSLASGTYDENKTVTVTVEDNNGITQIEYKLYKDEELVSSGNPTGDSITNVSFDVSLDNDGTWELLVKASDIVGNYNNQDVNSEGYSHRKYIIDTAEVCTEWVQSSAGYDSGCVPVGDENTGTSYTTCTLRYNYTKSRYCGNDVLGNPLTISHSSGYNYGTQSTALNACENYNLTCNIAGSSSNTWCSTETTYRKVVYERICE